MTPFRRRHDQLPDPLGRSPEQPNGEPELRRDRVEPEPRPADRVRAKPPPPRTAPTTRGGFRILRSEDEVAEATARAEEQLQRIVDAIPPAVRARGVRPKVRQRARRDQPEAVAEAWPAGDTAPTGGQAAGDTVVDGEPGGDTAPTGGQAAGDTVVDGEPGGHRRG